MEADLSDLSDSWRDTYSTNFQINQINPLPFFYRVHVCLTRRHKEKISAPLRLDIFVMFFCHDLAEKLYL